MLTREVIMSLQIKNKVPVAPLIRKEVSPIFRDHPRIPDAIVLAASAEFKPVVVCESGVSCGPEVGETCLEEDSLARHLQGAATLVNQGGETCVEEDSLARADYLH